MIQILFGDKGTGKTKRLIAMANSSIGNAKGGIVFLDHNSQYMYDVKRDIRFIDVSKFKIDSPKMFYGFICGIAAQDFDLEYVFIDGFLKIVHHELDTLKELFSHLKEFAEERSITIVFSISGDPSSVPEFIKEFII